MRYLVGLIFVFSFFLNVSAQEPQTEVVNGKKYRVHIVEPGNTLYTLHLKYEVSVEELERINPKAKEGLQIGQKLYIPLKEDKKTVKTTAENQNNQQVLGFTTHLVKRKETLYGISKDYNCTVEELITFNPGVEEGLKKGQELKIPIKGKVAEDSKIVKSEVEKQESANKAEDDEPILKESDVLSELNDPFPTLDLLNRTIQYEVKQGETLYSISRRYMVPVDSLVSLNHLEGVSIRTGQILTIPIKPEIDRELMIPEVSAVHLEETSGQLVLEKKKTYKILYALPLNIGKNSGVLSGVFTESTKLNHISDIAVEFLMGAQMALDSLETMGLNAEIEFFDTESSLDVFKRKLSTYGKGNLDLIIGPFYPKLMEYAAIWGKERNIPVVAASDIPNNIMKGNEYVYSTVPSSLTLIGGMAAFLAKYHANDNIVLITGENSATNERNTYFKESFNRNLPKGSSGRIRTSDIGGRAGYTLVDAIDPSKENFIICWSDSEQQVMRFVNALNGARNNSSRVKKSTVNMVGLKEWKNMTTLTTYYKNRFNFTFPSANFLDYEEENTNEFVKKYFERYKSDPSRFAFHGFDVTLSQIGAMVLRLNRNQGYVDYFDLKSMGYKNGFENVGVFIIQQKDFESKLLKVVSER